MISLLTLISVPFASVSLYKLLAHVVRESSAIIQTRMKERAATDRVLIQEAAATERERLKLAAAKRPATLTALYSDRLPSGSQLLSSGSEEPPDES